MNISAERLKGFGSVFAPIMRALAISAGIGGIGYLTAKKDQKHLAEHLAQSMSATFKSDPEFAKNAPLFKERFQELSMLAPAIAGNPKMAAKVLSSNMDKGFSIDDIHKLTMIQAYGIKPTGTNAASVAGRVAALGTLDKIVNVFGLPMYQDFLGRADKFNKWNAKATAALESQDAQTKTGSERNKHMERKVSDECIGEMLSDRYVLAKTANAGASITSSVASGAKAVGGHLGYMFPVLAFAGLAAAAGEIKDVMHKKRAEEAALHAFETVRKESDVIRGNPVLAAQAFDAIKSFALDLAGKPLILKTFIEHTIGAERLAPQTVSDLAAAQSNVNKANEVSGFASGLIRKLEAPLNLASSAAKFGHGDKK